MSIESPSQQTEKEYLINVIRYSIFLQTLSLFIREHLFVCKETIQGTQKRSLAMLED